MRLNNDKFFKHFKEDYLLYLNDSFKNKSITYIKLDIKKQFKKLQIKNNLKRLTIRNIDYWLIRGWSLDETLIKIKSFKDNWKTIKYSILNIEYWINKGYSYEDAKLKKTEIHKDRGAKAAKTRLSDPNHKKMISPFTEEYWINKGFTDKDEIKIKINSQRKNNINYWLNKGFSESESKIKVSDYQKENSQKSIKNWQSKKGTPEYNKKQVTNIEYYIDKGFSIEESEKLLKERQTTFTLEKCIIKNGIEKGTEIFNNRQDKWIKKMFNENTCMSTGRSLMSDKFIDKIIEAINDNNITKNFLYGIDERFIYDKISKKANRYDLCYNNKIIEFNGDFWHSNPKIFKADDIHRIKKIKCSDIWKSDNRKIESAKEHNYEVLIIWESEYINNETEIINKCKKFLIDEN